MKAFWVLGLSVVSFLLFFYVFQFDRMTKDSFLISDFSVQAKEASEQNLELESSFFKNESLNAAEELARSSNFEDVEDVKYIRVIGSAVAAKTDY
jgi:Ser-tRNA(Ala) deacylase AlaX